MLVKLKKLLKEVEENIEIGTKFNIVYENDITVPSILTRIDSFGLRLGKETNPEKDIFSLNVPLIESQMDFNSKKEHEIGFKVLNSIIKGNKIILISWNDYIEFFKNTSGPFTGRLN